MSPLEKKSLLSFARELMATAEPYYYEAENGYRFDVYELPAPGALPDWAIKYATTPPRYGAATVEIWPLGLRLDKEARITQVYDHESKAKRPMPWPDPNPGNIPAWSTAHDERPD